MLDEMTYPQSQTLDALQDKGVVVDTLSDIHAFNKAVRCTTLATEMVFDTIIFASRCAPSWTGPPQAGRCLQQATT